MQAVRKRILEILKRRKSATVGELARQLDMAPVSVRYHLDVLQGDNLIEVAKVRREGNVGRPKQVYALTREANEYFPDNFAPLTTGLVRQMKKMLPPEQLEVAFCGLARELAAEFVDAFSEEELAEFETEERLDHVVAFLNERGYLARWEKQSQADAEKSPAADEIYLLHTCNCPYAGVSSEHRELCQMDLAFVQELVGCACQRVDSLAEKGDSCTYRLQHAEEGVGSLVFEDELLVTPS